MKREELDAIRKRADKATPGPWYHTRWHVATEPNITGGYPPNPASICETADGEYIENYNEADAEFIANARQDVPALLAEVERLRTALQEIADIDDWDYGLEKAKDVTFKTINEPEGWS